MQEKTILFAGFGGFKSGDAFHSLLSKIFGFELKGIQSPNLYNSVKAVGVVEPKIRYVLFDLMKKQHPY